MGYHSQVWTNQICSCKFSSVANSSRFFSYHLPWKSEFGAGNEVIRVDGVPFVSRKSEMYAPAVVVSIISTYLHISAYDINICAGRRCTTLSVRLSLHVDSGGGRIGFGIHGSQGFSHFPT